MVISWHYQETIQLEAHLDRLATLAIREENIINREINHISVLACIDARPYQLGIERSFFIKENRLLSPL